MLGAILKAVASGYLSKTVQMLVNLSLLPYLVGDDVLGLGGYGLVSALLACAALLLVPFDGWCLDVSRRAGVAFREGRSDVAGVLLQSTAGAGMALLFAIAAWAGGGHWISGLVGLSEDVLTAQIILLLGGYIALFQASYPVEAALHASARTSTINWLVAVEVVLRAALVVTLFSAWAPSIEGYLAALVGTAFARFMAEVCALGRSVPFQAGGRRSPTRELYSEVRAFFQSSPLALQGASAFLVFRMPVLVANRFIGADAAGVVQILLGTTRTYLHQLLVSTVQPVMVPMAARMDVATLPPATRRKLGDLRLVHQVSSMAICVFLAVTSPIWLRLWLGDGLSMYAGAAALVCIAVGVEAGAVVLSQILVAHGEGRALGVLNGVCAGAAASVVLIIGMRGGSIEAVCGTVAAYVVLWHGMVTPTLYRRAIGPDLGGLGQAIGLLAVAGVTSVAAFVTAGSDGLSSRYIAAIASAVVIANVGASCFIADAHRAAQRLMNEVVGQFARRMR